MRVVNDKVGVMGLEKGDKGLSILDAALAEETAAAVAVGTAFEAPGG